MSTAAISDAPHRPISLEGAAAVGSGRAWEAATGTVSDGTGFFVSTAGAARTLASSQHVR